MIVNSVSGDWIMNMPKMTAEQSALSADIQAAILDLVEIGKAMGTQDGLDQRYAAAFERVEELGQRIPEPGALPDRRHLACAGGLGARGQGRRRASRSRRTRSQGRRGSGDPGCSRIRRHPLLRQDRPRARLLRSRHTRGRENDDQQLAHPRLACRRLRLRPD